MDKHIELSLPELLAEAYSGKVEAFFKDRLRTLLVERHYREDLVDAVLAAGCERPQEALGRLSALAGVSNQESFSNACKVVERTHNILKGNKEALPDKINPEVFSEELEQKVFGRYQECYDPVQKAISSGDFGQATSLYAEAFFAILNEFFEKVFINAEDLTVRKNRLALLQSIKELYTKEIADLSKIHPTRN